MRLYFILLHLFLLFHVVEAQQPKKPARPQEKPPTQKEMDEMVKEMENMLKNMTPEEKKMYDSMGIQLPNMKKMPKMTDKQLADAALEEGQLLPAKKTALINALPKTIFTDAQLTGYIKKINSSLVTGISAESKKMGDAVLDQYKNDAHYGAMVAAAANGMWLLGFKEPAVYLMGKAIELLPNADNYNNFAAYLTMSGAAHIAIPVLEKLNSIHKKNSTIYNNLGHAWLELGDEMKGEKYIDSAILRYPGHPQANFTKALLLEKKGKINEAAAAVKRSLKHSVTKRKIEKLKELEGKNVRPENFRFPKTYFSATFNPSLYIVNMPRNYATSAGGETEKEWIDFRKELESELKVITDAIQKNKSIAEDEVKKTQLAAKNMGGLPPLSPHYIRAITTYGKNPPSHVQFASSRTEQMEDQSYLKEWAMVKAEFEKEMKKAEDYINSLPNGSPLLLNRCPYVKPIVDKYILRINTLNMMYNERKMRLWVTEAYHLYDYYMSISMTPALAQDAILGLKKRLVSNLLLLKHESYPMEDCVNDAVKENPYKKRKLSDFDEITCATTSTLYVPLTGHITIHCNQMFVVFNPKLLPVKFSFTSKYYGNKEVITDASVGITVKATDLNIGGHFDKDGNFVKGNVSLGKTIKGVTVSITGEFDANGFTKGSAELGIKGEMNLLPKSITDMAPVELGMKGELGAGIEISKEGIEDWYVKEKTEIEMGASVAADVDKNAKDAINYTNEIVKEVTKDMGLEKKDKSGKPVEVKIPEPKISTGASISADNRWSVNSGYSVERSSQFSWLKN